MLADIFIYNIKTNILNKNILLFPAEYIADIFFINIKQLPFKLAEEKTDFDINAKNYYIFKLLSSLRAQRVIKKAKKKKRKKNNKINRELFINIPQITIKNNFKSKIIGEEINI